MNKKRNIVFYIISVLILAIFFSYSLVFASPMSEKPKKYETTTSSNNIFLDSISLNSVLLLTNRPAEKFKISGDCSLFGKLIGKKGNYSLFRLKVLDSSCEKRKIKVFLDFDGYKEQKTFNLISLYNIYSINLDKNTENLENIVSALDTKISKLNGKNQISKVKRNIEELNYMKNVFSDILKKRKQKYKIPVNGSKIPTKLSKIPNAGRPYRNNYTDGIHHGWDFDAKKGDSVISMDNGIIVRVKNDFVFSDLGNINHSKNLSEKQQLKNLDILRGNQVWLKTMKGDVAFYSHLDSIFPDIKEGMIIDKGQPIGTVGATGVPDRNYTDFHLHIPIHKNPYLKLKEGKYNFSDYMRWKWYFKGESLNYVIKHQGEIFGE